MAEQTEREAALGEMRRMMAEDKQPFSRTPWNHLYRVVIPRIAGGNFTADEIADLSAIDPTWIEIFGDYFFEVAVALQAAVMEIVSKRMLDLLYAPDVSYLKKENSRDEEIVWIRRLQKANRRVRRLDPSD